MTSDGGCTADYPGRTCVTWAEKWRGTKPIECGISAPVDLTLNKTCYLVTAVDRSEMEEPATASGLS